MTGNEMAPEARKLPVSLKESPKLKIASNGGGLGLGLGLGFETTLSRKPNVREVMIKRI